MNWSPVPDALWLILEASQDSVVIPASLGKVFGTIQAPNIQIDPGAYFEAKGEDGLVTIVTPLFKLLIKKKIEFPIMAKLYFL